MSSASTVSSRPARRLGQHFRPCCPNSRRTSLMTASPGAHRPRSRRRSPSSPLSSPRSPRPKTSRRRATADPGTSCSSASSTSISFADAAAPGCTTSATSEIPSSSTRSSVTSVCPPRCRAEHRRALYRRKRSILPTSTSPKWTTSRSFTSTEHCRPHVRFAVRPVPGMPVSVTQFLQRNQFSSLRSVSRVFRSRPHCARATQPLYSATWAKTHFIRPTLTFCMWTKGGRSRAVAVD
jgi:hypothetical protein